MRRVGTLSVLVAIGLALALGLAVAALLAFKLWREDEGIDRNLAAQPMDDLLQTQNIAYAPGDRHGLDIYRPADAEDARPVIIYLYGGAWTGGSKAQHAWVGAGLARQGYVAVVADYRLYPQVVWPAFLRDNALAVAWVKNNIADFGGDPDNIVLMGHSSGAFNAVSLALESQWLEEVGMSAARDLKAVVSISGVFNMLPLTGASENAIFAPETGYEELRQHVTGNGPPLLFIVGSEDRIAGPIDSELTAGQVVERGGVAELLAYSGLRHDDTQAAIGNAPDAPDVTIRADLARFLASQGVPVPR